MEADIYTYVKTSISRIYNINLDHYKDEQMRRRLDSWLARVHTLNWESYFDTLSKDTVERERFRDYLTINVTEFFRDPERWETLRKDTLPGLLKENGKGLRIWSAGCSIGVEPFSLAILLNEVSPNQSHYLLATDMDRGALRKANAHGPYRKDEIRNLSDRQCQDYLTVNGSDYFVKDHVARKVTFQEQDLFNDRFEQNFDLIVCRNVIIYFTNDAKDLLYKKFHAALRPGGILFLGGTEIIQRPKEIGLKNIGISLYKKE